LARGQRAGTGWKWERVLWEGKEPKEIRNLALDPEGRLLVAHQDGVSVWQRGQWSQLEEVLKALPSSMAFSLQGELLVSYINRPRLSRFRLTEGRYRLVGELDPFKKNSQILIFSLGIEANGRIWMGTSQGAARFEPGSPDNLRLFSMDDGIVSSDCGDGSLFVEADRVWIGTSQGLASFRTDLPSDAPSIQAPLLLSVHTGSKPLSMVDAPLVLPPASRGLDLRFLIPNYQLPGRLTYQSRLAGVDSDWVNLEQPRIHYPSLHPGRYLLELRGRLEDGTVGAVQALRFEILPRWWESRTAWGSYLLLGAGAIYGLVRLRQAQLESRNRELREEVARQTQAVQLASQAKSAFLANMSHELRTPLNAILLYSELLQEDAIEHGLKSIQADAAKIQGAGRHLLGLIDDILDVSKIEAGHMRLHVEDVELGPFLADLVATLGPVVERNGNRFWAELDQAPVHLRTDALRLRQVLSNLLSNAGKFTESGEVVLTVRTEENEIAFTVRDTGIGMSNEELKRVFQEFVQAETGTTRKYGGTGLGLALVRRFTELLGGRVEASSQPGMGTSFVVHLPKSGPPEPS
jgi:signal transduction histidine kinase